jgi:pyruvate/2-oxoglutarate dehydrogenase complex dihydrolipoamide acyltransferase (E2) component
MAQIKVLLPQWGMGMSEGKITKWYKNVGDSVIEDEPLADVETEKVTSTIESPGTGQLSKIFIFEGETTAVRTLIAIIEKD